MRSAPRQARRSALILASFAAAITLLLAGTWLATRAQVAANQSAARAALLTQALPAALFDNDLAASRQPLPEAAAWLLNGRAAANVYRASKAGRPSGVVFEAAAPNGYGGRIDLLIGIAADGKLQGVRVVGHKETPGLGDYIDQSVSSWARQFSGRDTASHRDWKVKKDGGDIDYVSGATISARAVAAAVGRVSGYFRDHRAALLQGNP
ncbi:RnfABCDGE type electron transport complex subunit G [Vogesella oryzae]|uniref:RnfABCDGE type electron transport complex subunit G n=1 Tax=Vogesella oryzae TaxID=1735285 RepID=UPI0015833F4A|nr:RnfABCDGE type electron transport complex subunit G [Vogesella oryzae]